MESIISKSIFSNATGFILRGGFDFTCNPFVGCTFGCSYCYAMFLPQNRRPKSDWGKWIQAKSNAIELAQKHAHKLKDKALYMSSVTDPYQPIEQSLRLTRGILEALLPHQPRLLIQTRGPLVCRDIDLLRQFQHIKVNFSMPTDCEDVARSLEPKAPPLKKRWQTLEELSLAGIPLGICVTPTLPIRDPDSFSQRILALKPVVVVIQKFHQSGGSFGADTPQKARESLANWQDSHHPLEELQSHLQGKCLLKEGEEGFFPP